MDLTIQLPDEEVPVLKAKAPAKGVSAEQYSLEVLEQDLATAAEPLRESNSLIFPIFFSVPRSPAQI